MGRVVGRGVDVWLMTLCLCRRMSLKIPLLHGLSLAVDRASQDWVAEHQTAAHARVTIELAEVLFHVRRPRRGEALVRGAWDDI
jgi:hypothetical protein